VLVEEKQDFAEVKEDEDAGEEKGTGAAAGSENAAPGDEERRIKALEAELAESINDRCPKTMEEVDEVISSIYDALGDGGEGPLSKDDALFALGMSPPPALYYAKKTVIIFLYYYVMYACIPLQPTNLKYTDLWDNSWDNAISMYFSL